MDASGVQRIGAECTEPLPPGRCPGADLQPGRPARPHAATGVFPPVHEHRTRVDETGKGVAYYVQDRASVEGGVHIVTKTACPPTVAGKGVRNPAHSL